MGLTKLFCEILLCETDRPHSPIRTTRPDLRLIKKDAANFKGAAHDLIDPDPIIND